MSSGSVSRTTLLIAVVATAIIVGGIVGGLFYYLTLPPPVVELSLVLHTEDKTPDQIAAWEEMISLFEHDNPNVNIELLLMPWNDIKMKMISMQAAGEPPAMANIYMAWFPALVEGGVLAELPDDLVADSQDNFATAHVLASTWKGTMYAMPAVGSTYSLYYNKKILDMAGIQEPPAEGWSIEEFRAAVTKLKQEYDIGFFIEQGWYTTETYPWVSMMWSNGGDLWDLDAKKVLFSSPEGIEAAEIYEWLIYDIEAWDPQATADAAYAKQMMADEEIGIMIVGTWYSVSLRELMGDEYFEENIISSPMPHFKEDPGGACPVSANTWVVCEGHPHKDIAWDFIRFITRPRTMGRYSLYDDYVHHTSGVPARLEAAKAPVYSSNWYAGTVREIALPNSRPAPVFWERSTEAFDIILKEFDALILEGKSPEDTLNDAAAKVQALFEE